MGLKYFSFNSCQEVTHSHHIGGADLCHGTQASILARTNDISFVLIVVSNDQSFVRIVVLNDQTFVIFVFSNDPTTVLIVVLNDQISVRIGLLHNRLKLGPDMILQCVDVSFRGRLVIIVGVVVTTIRTVGAALSTTISFCSISASPVLTSALPFRTSRTGLNSRCQSLFGKGTCSLSRLGSAVGVLISFPWYRSETRVLLPHQIWPIEVVMSISAPKS